MHASRLTANVLCQYDAQRRPIVVIDEAGTVIFGNRAWASLERKSGRAAHDSLGSTYQRVIPVDTTSSKGLYAQATIDQAISELLSDRQTVFTQTCLINLGAQIQTYNLLFTQCRFADGGRGAVIWMEPPRAKRQTPAPLAVTSEQH